MSIPNFSSGGWDGFEACFSDERQGRRRLEATPIHLYQETALRHFAALSPQPVVLVTLRCPAEQIRSAFYFHRSFGRIDAEMTFGTYARAMLDDDVAVIRKAVPRSDTRATLQPAMHHNRYAEWLDLWAQHFPRERLVITTLRELSQDPVPLLRGICTQLGVDPSHFDDDHFVARKVNATSAGRVVEPGWLQRMGRRVVPHGRIRQRLATWDQARRAGAPLGAPSPADDEVLELLGKRFEPDNRDLAARYGVDISGWRPVKQDAPRRS